MDQSYFGLSNHQKLKAFPSILFMGQRSGVHAWLGAFDIGSVGISQLENGKVKNIQ